MRYLLLLSFIFHSSVSFNQTKKIKYDYTTGRIESTGKVVICPNFVNKYLCDDGKCKKTGKWIYYYQNGNIKRIENYKKIKDCNSNAIPHGIWQYFNEQGLLLKKEEYKEGKMWNAGISKYYYNKELAGEIRIINGLIDTLAYFNIDSLNLIRNGDFGLYLDKPQLIITNGQNQIENQIPFWITPNSNTPDYYNQFRKLSKVPDNLPHDYNESYNYVGIILYHEPLLKYSEYITGELNHKLENQKKYCFKIRLRLSQNSGYYINSIGVYFSQDLPIIPNSVENQQNSPQLVFNENINNRESWTTYCNLYTAHGDDRYITIGRFSSLSETVISKIKPISLSEGELNQSAYYLVDKVELYEDTTFCTCNNKKQEHEIIERINFELFNPDDSLQLSVDKTFILNNIFFDFDKSILLPASFQELEKLLNFLKSNNVSITIMGHTDNFGSDEYNNFLSLSRANAVNEWLINKGIESNRIKIEGYGSKYPIVENNSVENRAINRRVEFKVNQK